MRPDNIQLSLRGHAMPILLIFIILIHASDIGAQTCGTTLGSAEYDTVFTGANGTGSAVITIARLDPSKKMVYAVVAQSSFTLDEGPSGSAVSFFNLGNTDIPAPQSNFQGFYVWFTTGPGFSDFNNTIAPLTDPVTHVPYTVTGPPLPANSSENVPFDETALIPGEYDSITAVQNLLDFTGTDTNNILYILQTNPYQYSPGIIPG